MNSVSTFAPRAIAMLLATLTLAAICSLLPRTAHATTWPTGLGQIERFHHAVDAGQRQLTWGPTNEEASAALKAKPVELKVTYTINTLDAYGMPVQNHIVIDCTSGDMAACQWATAAAKAMGFYHNPSRGRKAGMLGAYCATANAYAVCSGPGHLPAQLNAAIATAKATSTKK